MQELRELFNKIMMHIGITGPEGEEVSKTFFNQVYAIFVERLLKLNLPDETFNKRIKEYQEYIKDGKHDLVHNDVKHYMNKESGKLFAESFLKHLKFFAHGLKDKGDITAEQVREIGEILKAHIQNRQAVNKVQNVENQGEALQNLAGTNSSF